MTKTKDKGKSTKKPAVAAASAVKKAKGRKSPGRNRVNEETMAMVEQGGPRISQRLSLKRKKSAESFAVSYESNGDINSEPTPTKGASKKKKTEMKIEQTTNNNCEPAETDAQKSSKKNRGSESKEDQAKLETSTDKAALGVEQTVKKENESPYEKLLAGLQLADPLPIKASEVLRDEKSDVLMMSSFVMKYVHPTEELLENALKDPVVYSVRNSLMERSQSFDQASQIHACLDKVAWENTVMKRVMGTLKSVDKDRLEVIAKLKADNQRLNNMLNEERSRFCVDWRNRDAERLVEETRKSAEEQNFYLKEQVHCTIDNLKSQYDNQLKELDEDRKKLAAENDSIHRRNERQRRVVEQLKKENESYSKSSKLLSKYFSIMQWMLVRVVKDLQKSDPSVRTGFDFQLTGLTSSLMDSLIGFGTKKIDFELSDAEELGIKRLFESMKSKIKQKVKPSDLRNFIKSLENQTCHEDILSDTEVEENEEKNLQRLKQAEIPDIPQDLVPSIDSVEVPAPFLALVDHGERHPTQTTDNLDFDQDVGIMSETDDESTPSAPGEVTAINVTNNREQEQSTAVSSGEPGETAIPEIQADDIVPASNGDTRSNSNRNIDCSNLYNEVGIQSEKEDEGTLLVPVATEEAIRNIITDCQEEKQNSAGSNQILLESCHSGDYELVENSASCFEFGRREVSVDISVNTDSKVDLPDIFHNFEITNNQLVNSDINIRADSNITTSPQNEDANYKSALSSDNADEDSEKNIEQNRSDYFVTVNEAGSTCEELNTLQVYASGSSSDDSHAAEMISNTSNEFLESDLSSNNIAGHTELGRDDHEIPVTDICDTSSKILSQDLELSESDECDEDDASDTYMTVCENESEQSFSEYEKEDMIKKATDLGLIPLKLEKLNLEKDDAASKSGPGVASDKARNKVESSRVTRLPLPPRKLDNGSSQKNINTSNIPVPARQKRIQDLPSFSAAQTRLPVAEKSSHVSVKSRLSRSCQTIVPVNETSNLCQKKRFEESMKASAQKRLAQQLSRDNKGEQPARAPSRFSSSEGSSSNSGNEKASKVCSVTDDTMLKLHSTEFGSSYTAQVPPLGKSRIARTRATSHATNSTSSRMPSMTSGNTMKSRQSRDLLQLLKKRREGGKSCKSKIASPNLKREEASFVVKTNSEESNLQMLPYTLKEPSVTNLQMMKRDKSRAGRIEGTFKSPPPPRMVSPNVSSISTMSKNTNWPATSSSAVTSQHTQQQILPQLNPGFQSSCPLVPHQFAQLTPDLMQVVNQAVQNTLSQYLNSINAQIQTSISGPFGSPTIPFETSHPSIPTSCVSNTAVLPQTQENCELGSDNQETYDSPMSPSAEMQTYTEDEPRNQIFSDKEWKFLEKPESCMIKSWCSRFLAELSEDCDRDVSNGEFEKINSKYFTQLTTMDLKSSGNVYMALACQVYDYVRLRDPADLHDSENPVKDDYVKLATIMRKMASKNFGEFDFSKLPELMFEFFEKQVMPNRFKHFGNEDLTLNKLGRFYSHLGKEFHLQSRAVDLLLQAVYYRPPHAFSLGVAMFKIDLPFIPSSDFESLSLKLRCVLYCLLAPMRFKDALGYAKLRNLMCAIQFKVTEKPYKQFVFDIIDELKELESSSALKEGCKCLGALLMLKTPKENIQFIGEAMASVTLDWKNGTVNDGMFAHFISSIGQVFGDTMDSIDTDILQKMTAIFENLIKGTKDSKFTNKAARETLNRVKNRLRTKANWVWTWKYVKNFRHERPGGKDQKGQKKKYRKHRKAANASSGQSSKGQVSSSTKP